jgi:putative transposase
MRPKGSSRPAAPGLSGASWQRGRGPFLRNLLATVPHGAREPVAALVRTLCAPPDHRTALAQLKQVADGRRPRFPPAAARLEDAAEEVRAPRHCPVEHRARLHSTTPLARLPKEVKRRAAVGGMFPNRAALRRLVGAILAAQDAAWAVADRRDCSAASMKPLTPPLVTTSQEDLLAAIA